MTRPGSSRAASPASERVKAAAGQKAPLPVHSLPVPQDRHRLWGWCVGVLPFARVYPKPGCGPAIPTWGSRGWGVLPFPLPFWVPAAQTAHSTASGGQRSLYFRLGNDWTWCETKCPSSRRWGGAGRGFLAPGAAGLPLEAAGPASPAEGSARRPDRGLCGMRGWRFLPPPSGSPPAPPTPCPPPPVPGAARGSARLVLPAPPGRRGRREAEDPQPRRRRPCPRPALPRRRPSAQARTSAVSAPRGGPPR